jgi:hypothetical protein
LITNAGGFADSFARKRINEVDMPSRPIVFIGFALVLAGSNAALCEQLSGKWFMNANGYLGDLNLSQSGARFSGDMHEDRTPVNGSISDGGLDFVRSEIGEDYPDQVYRGKEFIIEGKRWLVGKFQDTNFAADFRFDWCAVENPRNEAFDTLSCPAIPASPDFKWTKLMD